MSRLRLVATILTILLGFLPTGRGADDGKVMSEAESKVVVTQLISGDPQKVDAAFASIRQLFERDPKQAGAWLDGRWMTALVTTKRYDEIAAFALTGAIACVGDLSRLESLQQARVRALIAAGRAEDAVAAAKSLYNVCSMRGTSAAIDLVIQALGVARKDDPGIGRKYRLQQLEGTNTNAPANAVDKPASLLNDVKVDPALYEAAITRALQVDAVAITDLRVIGNLYLLADQARKAEEIFKRYYDWADQSQLTYAIEGVARAMRAADGTVGRANAWILAQRAKAQ